MSLRADLSRAIAEARDRAIEAGELTVAEGATLPAIGLERPAKPEHGDWASNVAMQLAPVVRAAPMRIAETIVAHLEQPASIAKVSIAAPGFLNLHLDPGWVAAQAGPIRAAGSGYGRHTVDAPRRINVEFVSANPTGPLHVGNARGAFVGDVLSRVLGAVGHPVEREYYFNDFGAQVVNLGLSVLARRNATELPEDGYRGEYVEALAAELPDEVAARAADQPGEAGRVVGAWATERVRAGIEASLARLGVEFDVWKEESSLHDGGWVERAVGQLRAGGHVFEDEGATWFRSTAFGDDKDRVIFRSNGLPTYFASDIGYVTE
ncbi:MAG: arginine--tRNA ligase, partial [Candidatus Limnocylindria bacterium]